MSERALKVRVAGVTKVVNNTHRLWQIHDALAALENLHGHPAIITAHLVRRPDNPVDPNAIEVHVQHLGMIGWVPAAVAVRLAPHLDSGNHQFDAWISAVLIHPDHPDNPGVELRIELHT